MGDHTGRRPAEAGEHHGPQEATAMYPGYYGQYPPAYPYRPARTSAPVSVHLAAFVLYLSGLLVLLAAAAVYAVTRGAAGTAGAVPAEVSRAGVPAAIALALYALCWLFVGRKVQRGRQWARVLVLVLSVLSVVGGVVEVLRTGASGLTVGQFVVPVLLVLLLNTTAARSWFRYHTY
jgi:hypothetical protein